MTVNHLLITKCCIFTLLFICLQPYLCIPDDEVPEIRLCQTVDRDLPLSFVTITVEISNPEPSILQALPDRACGTDFRYVIKSSVCNISDTVMFSIENTDHITFVCLESMTTIL